MMKLIMKELNLETFDMTFDAKKNVNEEDLCKNCPHLEGNVESFSSEEIEKKCLKKFLKIFQV
jgi:hypothetical protein